MKKLKIYSLICGLVISSCSLADIKIENQHLIVDGKNFFINGMAYSPEPRGFASVERGVFNFLTSVRSTPFWEYKQGAWLCMAATPDPLHLSTWKSACYDSDFFGILTFPGAWEINERYNQALRQQWEYDLADMQAMGVNTLRLYTINPLGKDHREFLDRALAHGMHVIYPIFNYYLCNKWNEDRTEAEAEVQSLITEVCNHPAILMYSIGNELLLERKGIPYIVNTVNNMVKTYCPQALTTYADYEVSRIPAIETILPNVDIYTFNIYRGDPSSDPGSKYVWSEYFATIKKMHKPSFVSEVGVWDTVQKDGGYSLNWFNYLWAMVLRYSAETNNLGAVYFEYNDEPVAKRGRDRFMGVTTAAWPTAAKDQFVAVPNLKKDLNYAGIPVYQDPDLNGTTVIFGDRDNKGYGLGRGRYEMFVPVQPQGVQYCNYLYSANSWAIHPECQKIIATWLK